MDKVKKEIKKARKRTCKKCGSKNAELIGANINCPDCGYNKDMFDGILLR